MEQSYATGNKTVDAEGDFDIENDSIAEFVKKTLGECLELWNRYDDQVYNALTDIQKRRVSAAEKVEANHHLEEMRLKAKKEKLEFLQKKNLERTGQLEGIKRNVAEKMGELDRCLFKKEQLEEISSQDIDVASAIEKARSEVEMLERSLVRPVEEMKDLLGLEF